jgi:Tol biopolymer transport system component
MFVALLVSLLAAHGVAASTPARVVYECGAAGENLCAARADGSQQRALTTDGRRSSRDYDTPSLSRDGRRLTFALGGELFIAGPYAGRRRRLVAGTERVTAAALRDDGRRVAYVHQAADCPRRGSGSLRPCSLRSTLFTVDVATARRRRLRFGISAADWWKGRLVAVAESGDIACLLTPTGSCRRVLVRSRGRALKSLAVSPGGRWLAVAGRTRDARRFESLLLFSTATGRLARRLTRGCRDRNPAWSPDGRYLVFARADRLYKLRLARGSRPQALGLRGSRPTLGA